MKKGNNKKMILKNNYRKKSKRMINNNNRFFKFIIYKSLIRIHQIKIPLSKLNKHLKLLIY